MQAVEGNNGSQCSGIFGHVFVILSVKNAMCHHLVHSCCLVACYVLMEIGMVELLFILMYCCFSALFLLACSIQLACDIGQLPEHARAHQGRI